MVLILEEEYARWTNPSTGEQEPATSEKPIQNDQGFKIWAQSCPGEGYFTESESAQKINTQPKPTKVKSTKTELATSEKPIQNEQGLKICAQSFHVKED